MKDKESLDEIRALTQLADVDDPFQLTRLTNKENGEEKVLSAFQIRGDTCKVLFDELDETRAHVAKLEAELRIERDQVQYVKTTLTMERDRDRSVLTDRVAVLESESKSVRRQLYSALQGAEMDSCPDNTTMPELSERVSSSFLKASDMMGAHFEYEWEVMAGAYGDGADAVPTGVETLIDRVKDLESGLHEIAASFERQPEDADDPGEVARIVKDEARRLGEIEAERKAIMGMSQDCDGTATTPLQAFDDVITALEAACTTSAERGRRVAELEYALRAWRCDTVPGRCRGCPDCRGIMPDQRGEGD